MFEKFLLTNFSSRKEKYIESINKLKTELNHIITGVKDLNEADTDNEDLYKKEKAKLNWAIKRFPLEEIDDLNSSSYIKKQSLFKTIVADLGNKFSELSDALNGQQVLSNFDPDPFIKIDNGLSLLRTKIQNYFSRLKLGIQSLFLVPLILSVLVNAYYKLGRGFEVVSDHILTPAFTFSQEKDNHDIFRYDEEKNKEYWEELSNYFFYLPNEFKKKYNTDQHHLSKFVIRSKHATKPTLLHNISMDVTFEEAAIDWSNLNVMPKPEVYDDDRSFIIDNRIGAPLRDVQIRLTDQEEKPIGIASFDQILFGYRSIDPYEMIPDEFEIFVDSYDHAGHIKLYYLLDKLPEEIEADSIANTLIQCDNVDYVEERFFVDGYEKYFNVGNQWYEIIYDSRALEKHINVYKLSDINVDYAYKDLKKRAYNLEYSYYLSDPIVYYENNENMSDTRPSLCFVDMVDYDSDGIIDMFDSEPASMFISFAESFVGTPKYVIDPKGLPMIIDTFHIVLNERGEGQALQNLDAILNPLGYIISYAKIDSLKQNGIYTITHKVNGKTRGQIKFENRYTDLSGLDYFDVDPINIDYSDEGIIAVFGEDRPDEDNRRQIINETFGEANEQ